MFPERQSRSFLDTRVLSRLAAVPLMSRRPMQGTVSGRHPSPHRGSSVEFAEYRKYVPGDDLRRLDWRAYGRSDRFYIKEYEADTNLRCCLVLDTSGSMNFTSHAVTKIEYAAPTRRGHWLVGVAARGCRRIIVRRRRRRGFDSAAPQSGASVGCVRFIGASPAEGGYEVNSHSARVGRDHSPAR